MSLTKIQIAFAENGRHGVILRQGPSKWTRMIKWDTKTDRLTEGQWIHSKVRYFDINSDASLILCFIQSYRREPGTWVALSKPPWFTARAIWKIGDSWGGYCQFLTDKKIYVSKGINPIVFEGSLPKGMRWS